jgi:glycosyltransferase involved in cell wall biosynthesis
MTAPLHVALNAHLLSGEASYRSAGIHGYLFNTLAHLPDVDPGIAYTVFVGAGRVPERAEWAVRRSRLPTRSPVLRILWEQACAPLELAGVRPDLLHGMGFAVPLLWPGPSVVTIFDLSFLRFPEYLGAGRRLYLRLITRLSARRARRVIAISESGKAEIGDLLGVPDSRIDVAVPGVRPDFRPLPPDRVADIRRQLQLPERYILYVGTLEPRKNLATLLRAYARLPRRSAVKLVLVGSRGWRAGAIFALIEELGLEQDVITPGYVTGENLPMWYNPAEMFVYPSVYEGFGLPLLEAMACGVPVIASDTTSLPEAVGPGGLLLPPADVDAWAGALSDLLDDPTARAAQSERGLKWAAGFTWENTARQTVAAYRKALTGFGT